MMQLCWSQQCWTHLCQSWTWLQVWKNRLQLLWITCFQKNALGAVIRYVTLHQEQGRKAFGQVSFFKHINSWDFFTCLILRILLRRNRQKRPELISKSWDICTMKHAIWDSGISNEPLTWAYQSARKGQKTMWCFYLFVSVFYLK